MKNLVSNGNKILMMLIKFKNLRKSRRKLFYENLEDDDDDNGKQKYCI